MGRVEYEYIWGAPVEALVPYSVQRDRKELRFHSGDNTAHGSFTNYIDTILVFSDHLSTYSQLTFGEEFIYRHKGKSAYQVPPT